MCARVENPLKSTTAFFRFTSRHGRKTSHHAPHTQPSQVCYVMCECTVLITTPSPTQRQYKNIRVRRAPPTPCKLLFSTMEKRSPSYLVSGPVLFLNCLVIALFLIFALSLSCLIGVPQINNREEGGPKLSFSTVDVCFPKNVGGKKHDVA
jgi:hypothetical protein